MLKSVKGVLRDGSVELLEKFPEGANGQVIVTLFTPDAAHSAEHSSNDPLIVNREGPLPSWLKATTAALNELARLPENWDSYGAGTIRQSYILAAMDLLLRIMRDNTPPPSVVPTNRGSVLLEWHLRGIDLEIEVAAHGQFHVVFEDVREGTEWEADVSSHDLTRVIEPVEMLSTRA